MSDLQIVLTTAPDPLVAEAIARALVDSQLAACVSLLPGITSVYRWQGEVETAREVQLLIKTRAANLPALMNEITRLHPYALPELVAIPIEGGLPAYLEWVRFGSTPPVRRICRRSTRPSACSWAKASSTTPRATCHSRASWRADGRRAPGASTPAWICSITVL